MVRLSDLASGSIISELAGLFALPANGMWRIDERQASIDDHQRPGHKYLLII
jgi:hypothetical protein